MTSDRALTSDPHGPALRIGPLHGGGLVLGYRCSSRCRHCLYGCGPHRRDTEAASVSAVEGLLDQLQQRAPGASYHIGGGEPFLDLGRLLRVVRGMRQRGMHLQYVETNASWADSAERASDALDQLADAGLTCVLVSLSPFHAEHIPLRRTLTLIEVANRRLAEGAFVWIPQFAADLAQQPPDERLDLDTLIEARGEGYARGLMGRYSLVPAGRAGRFAHDHGQRQPWERLATARSCAGRLADTRHFHVDLERGYVPGLCAGIVLPLHEVLDGEVQLARYPVLAALVRGGVAELVEMARERGFVPLTTYAASCDLCTHVRIVLHRHDASGYPELGPEGFYDPRSIGGYEAEPVRPEEPGGASQTK